MARYIDADALSEEIDKAQMSLASNDDIVWERNKKYYKGLCWARSLVNEQPTADVAPRAEVANKICCEIEEEIVAALESNYRALKEWDDGRCNDYILEMVNRIKGKIDALRGIEAFVEELKKKYKEDD